LYTDELFAHPSTPYNDLATTACSYSTSQSRKSRQNASTSSTLTDDCIASLITSNKPYQNKQSKRRRLELEFKAKDGYAWIQ
jgi:hypothetical protein